MHRPHVLLLVLTTACGGAQHAPEGLPCAGQTREEHVDIPELGPLPSGEPVTAGTSMTCSDAGLAVLVWGADSSASYAVAPDRAMAVWSAFETPGSYEARWLAVLLAIGQ